MPAPGFPFFKGLNKPFGGSWGLLGASWGLSWPCRGKMREKTIDFSTKKSHFSLRVRRTRASWGPLSFREPFKPFEALWWLWGSLGALFGPSACQGPPPLALGRALGPRGIGLAARGRLLAGGPWRGGAWPGGPLSRGGPWPRGG